MRVGFIGFGNMAQALAASWKLMPELTLYASSPSLTNTINCDKIHTSNDNLFVAAQCDVVILAVKPQQALLVMQQIAASLLPNSVVVSIVAGLTLQKLENLCNVKQAIVRSMPNLPVAKCKGATPLLANTCVSTSQRSMVDKLFTAVGIAAWVATDDVVDKLTALSGSGPAYILYFLEALMQAGLNLGLTNEDARLFTLQTMRGTIALLDDDQMDLRELRRKITSPKGTTAAAIQSLEAVDFVAIMSDAVKAAYQRAKELALT
jgi:pyrroline-5-carboxylate reductase